MTIILILISFMMQPFSQDRSDNPTNKETATATFGAGCFWCVESIFQNVTGVESVTSGYMGGHMENPAYEDVCTGRSGHAEVCKIEFDENTVSYRELLEIFFSTHDPTTLNRQGNDTGTQYRSAIFYHTGEQKKFAEEYKKKFDSSGIYSRPIVTEIAPAGKFYPAENYHRDYYNQNKGKPYCTFVIRPKLEKFQKQFSNKIKK